MKDLPRSKIVPKPDFALIPQQELDRIITQFGIQLMKEAPERRADLEAVVRHIKEEIGYLNDLVLPRFKYHGRQAKEEQNRYRFYQITYMSMSAFAALLGGMQALVARELNNPLLFVFAFAETLVAIVAVSFVQPITSRKPPLPLWLRYRRRAEALRQEYFRYLGNQSPYDKLAEPPERHEQLHKRLQNIIKDQTHPTESPEPTLAGGDQA